MTYYLSRAQAAKRAEQQGITNFQCFEQKDMHRYVWKRIDWPDAFDHPAREWAKGKDFVSHLEARLNDDKRTFRGIVVVTDTPTDEERAEINALNCDVEPITTSLFDASVTKDLPQRAPSAPRAKSDAASPTKLVWEIADSMPGASREEVVATCEAQGVNKSTAQTQYYRWKKAKKA